MLIFGDLSSLLALPLMSAEFPSLRLHWYQTAELVVNFAIPAIHLAANASISFLIQQRHPLFCDHVDGDVVAKLNLATHYPRICISVVMNAILLQKQIFSLLFPGRPDHLSAREFIYAAGCIAMSLEMWVWELLKSDLLQPQETSWGFGQLTAMLGSITIAVQVWEYGRGQSKVNVNVPRYEHWKLESTRSLWKFLSCSSSIHNSGSRLV